MRFLTVFKIAKIENEDHRKFLYIHCSTIPQCIILSSKPKRMKEMTRLLKSNMDASKDHAGHRIKKDNYT